MTPKIAFIGAGSLGFTRQLVRDILSVPELQDAHLSFTDISERNLAAITTLCRREIDFNHLPARLTSSLDRREALAGADYVISTIRQGGLEAFELDIDIPLQYGVDQCVGDTLGPGGLMYAQRSIPVLLEFCRDMREVASPDVLFLNYSNPMAMNTWACNRYGGVRTIGLCHGVQNGHWQLAHVTERWAKSEGLIAPDETVHRNDIEILAAGINHQTWYLKALWRGIDLIPKLLDLFEGYPEYAATEKVRIDVLRRFGYYSTESNGHLSEYLPWYRKRLHEIPQWIDLSYWIHGETGGYLRTCRESRNWFDAEYGNWLREEVPAYTSALRSEEHGSYIIEALETGRSYRGHFNVINAGHITNLPDGCVIEIPGYVSNLGIQMPVVGNLPLACAATCNASIRVQEMGVEAAVHGDVMLLKQALLHDPLTGAVCNPEEVWQMADELLIAEANWLPQYAHQIDAAQKRLAAAERDGRRVKRITTSGAARLPTRSAQEMAATWETEQNNAPFNERSAAAGRK
jgi:alpha-galactosidase